MQLNISLIQETIHQQKAYAKRMQFSLKSIVNNSLRFEFSPLKLYFYQYVSINIGKQNFMEYKTKKKTYKSLKPKSPF